MKSLLDLEVKWNDQAITTETQKSSLKAENQNQEAKDAYLKQKVLGAILHLKGLNEEASREALKEAFDNYARVKYVDFNRGQTEGKVRFSEENQAKEVLKKALEANNGELLIRGSKVEARVLEGDEEQEYWNEILRRLSESRDRKKINNKYSRGGKKFGKNNAKFNKNKRNLDNIAGEDQDKNGNDDDDDKNMDDSNKKLKSQDN